MRTLLGAAATLLLTLALASAAPAAKLKLQGFDVPPGVTGWVAPGPDGNVWFTSEQSGNYLGRVTPRGAVTAFPISTPGADPDTIVRGPDGALWYTLRSGNRVGRITTSGQAVEFPVPTPNSAPRGIATGPDGALWFTEFQA